MKIGLDIDDTISANPAFFAELCQNTYKEGGSVIIISSRSDIDEVRVTTTEQLREWSICYDRLYLFKRLEEVELLCPIVDLDWYQKLLWQKVHYCINENIDCYYEDEDKVIALFKEHAPDIKIIDAKKIATQKGR